MSVKVQSMVWDADIEHNQKFVLLALADQANDFGKECWPSIAHLAAKCNLTDRAIQKNLKKLEERGLISRNARYGRSTYFTIYLPKIAVLKRQFEAETSEDDHQDGAKVIHSPEQSSPRQNDTPNKVRPEQSSPITILLTILYRRRRQRMKLSTTLKTKHQIQWQGMTLKTLLA